MKKIVLLVLGVFLFNSCSVLYPDGMSFRGTNYSYANETFASKLDFKKHNYLLVPTNFSDGLDHASIIEEINDFFKPRLKYRMVSTENLRNSKGKKVIPFILNYDSALDNIDFLAEVIDGYQFLILTKVVFLDAYQKELKSKRAYVDKDYKSYAKSSIMVLDLENKSVFLEMSTTGVVSFSEDGREYGNSTSNNDTMNLYKSSYTLGRKTMKKLLERLK